MRGIVCGDFNNAQCHGNLNQKFNRKDYEGCAQINYNLNIIKDEFNQRGFIMADCTKSGKEIQTWGNIPEDHIFIRGRGFSVSECKAVKVDRLLDHDILFAKCNLEY